jgi:hypothetical protein
MLAKIARDKLVNSNYSSYIAQELEALRISG